MDKSFLSTVDAQVEHILPPHPLRRPVERMIEREGAENEARQSHLSLRL
jgi:hypothetical protein